MNDQDISEQVHGVNEPARQERAGIGKLAAALAKAQAQFTNPERNRTVTVRTKPKEGRPAGKYTFKYAELGTILDVVRKPLADNGLAVLQQLQPRPDGIYLRTLLVHQSGECVHADLPVGAAGLDLQVLGGRISYVRRYALSALLGIASEPDADEQQEVHEQQEPPPRRAPQQSVTEKPKSPPRPWLGKPDYKIPYKSDRHVFVRLDPVNGQPLQAEVEKLDSGALAWLDEQLLPAGRGKYFHDQGLPGMVSCCDRDRKLVSAEMLRRSEQPEPEQDQPPGKQKDLLDKPKPTKAAAQEAAFRVAVHVPHLNVEADAKLAPTAKALNAEEIAELRHLLPCEVAAIIAHPANRKLFTLEIAGAVQRHNVTEEEPLSGAWLSRAWVKAAEEAGGKVRIGARRIMRLAITGLELGKRDLSAGPVPEVETFELDKDGRAQLAAFMAHAMDADKAIGLLARALARSTSSGQADNQPEKNDG